MTPRTLRALRYVAPLREGGSLPAVVETDGGLFAVKFLGAGQGARALVAELIVGGLAASLGLPIPEVALVTLAEGFGRAEPDPEIQDILRGSVGPNVGLAFLDGAFPYDPVACEGLVDETLASDIVWLDTLTTNVDRTARNPNLLVTTDGLHLMDHGAALYFHHDWPSVTEERTVAPFRAIADHVLLPLASALRERDAVLAGRLTDDVLRAIVGAVPDDLLMHTPQGREPAFDSPDGYRDAYLRWLRTRLGARDAWLTAAVEARDARLAAAPTPLPYRR